MSNSESRATSTESQAKCSLAKIKRETHQYPEKEKLLPVKDELSDGLAISLKV